MNGAHQEPDGLAGEIPGEAACQQGPRFLVGVLDDLPVTGQLIALVLRTNLDCRVVVYTSAAELLEDEESVPDLYLLDIMLEGESGIEVCRKLRKDPKRCRVPVVFLSAHGKPEIRVAALKAGGSDYLDKPFYPEELLVRVKAQLALQAADQRLEEEMLRMRGELAEWEKRWRPLAAEVLDFVREAGKLAPELASRADLLEQRLEEFEQGRETWGGWGNVEQWHPARFFLLGALQRAVLKTQPECAKLGVQIQVMCPEEAACYFDEEFFVEEVVVALLREALRRPLPSKALMITVEREVKLDKPGWNVFLFEGSREESSGALGGFRRGRLNVVGVKPDAGKGALLNNLVRMMAAHGGEVECWNDPAVGPVVRVWVGE